VARRQKLDYEPNRRLVVDRLRERCLELGAQRQPLPSEAQLSLDLGVSRATVRDALTRLETEGLLLRRKGADTIVNLAALDLRARIDLQVDFAVILTDAGYEATVVLIEATPDTITGDVAAILGVPEGTSGFRTAKRWDADGRPAMVAVDWIPTPGGPRDVDPLRPVFELAAELTGEEVGWEIALPGAIAVDGEIADWLSVVPGTAVWTLDRVGVGRTGFRSFMAREYHLPSFVQYGFVRPLPRR
jgi:GntR family transcriptional regulator